jgi:hypothetical protein
MMQEEVRRSVNVGLVQLFTEDPDVTIEAQRCQQNQKASRYRGGTIRYNFESDKAYRARIDVVQASEAFEAVLEYYV